MSSVKRLLIGCLLLMLLSGCAFMPFEDPEDQWAEARAAAEKQAELAEMTPAEAQTDDLCLDEQLRNDLGRLLADYRIAVPQFSTDGAHAQVYRRINDYYAETVSSAREDCDSFFAGARSYYGEEWATAQAPRQLFSIDIGYRLTDAPDGYLCVERTYKMKSGSPEVETHYTADVFLLDSGWRLTLPELFGEEHYPEAAALLMEEIRAWCVANGMTAEAADALTIEDFAPGFGLDRDQLLFFVSPFTLSTSDGAAHTVSVPMSKVAHLLPDNTAS